MAQNTNISIGSLVYTPLCNADVTAARVQNQSGVDIYIQAAASATAPTSNDGAILIRAYDTFAADYTLAQIFPGITGANRLYAKSTSSGQPAVVSVSHA